MFPGAGHPPVYVLELVALSVCPGPFFSLLPTLLQEAGLQEKENVRQEESLLTSPHSHLFPSSISNQMVGRWQHP